MLRRALYVVVGTFALLLLAACGGMPGQATPPAATPTPGVTFNVQVDNNGSSINIQSNAAISGSISLPPMTVAPISTPSSPPSDGSTNSMPNPLGSPPSDEDDTVLTVPTIEPTASPNVVVIINNSNENTNDNLSGNTATYTGTMPVDLTVHDTDAPVNDPCATARWLGSFDQNAFEALEISELHVIRTPNTVQGGCLHYFDHSGREGYLSWNNSNSVVTLMGDLLDTRERYLINSIEYRTVDDHKWVIGLTLRRWVE